MHDWSDNTFDWKGLSEAEDYMYYRMTRLARIGVHAKEKFGTLRLYCYFISSIHSFIYPGYMYNQYPYKWMWTLDVYYGDKFLRYTGLGYIIGRWQKFIYVDTYRRAVKKWPHLKEEITCCADQDHWLKEAGVVP